MDITHIAELAAIVIGGSVAIVRFWPELKQVAIFGQLFLLLLQAFNMYMKNNPDKRKKMQLYFEQMIHHYFTTHPTGQAIAGDTKKDEEISCLLTDRPFYFEKEPTQNSLYRALGIQFDKEEKSAL